VDPLHPPVDRLLQLPRVARDERRQSKQPTELFLNLARERLSCQRDAQAEHEARPCHVPGAVQGELAGPSPKGGDEEAKQVSQRRQAERRQQNGGYRPCLRQ